MAGPLVVVAGALANKPANGGEAWVRLSWVRGLERLGCRVALVEEIAEASCTDTARRPAVFAASVNRAWFADVTARFGLTGRAGLVCDNGEGEGLTRAEVADLAAGADLLVNISGHLADPELFGAFRRRAYVDIDPGFTQFWHAAGQNGARLAGHHRYFTIGELIGDFGCPIPVGEFRWRPTRQPVVLDDWPATDHHPAGGAATPAATRFTTVASWRGPFGPVETDRRRFGLKVHEFRKFLPLPGLVSGARFEAALAIHPEERPDLALLHDGGWALADPTRVAGTPDAFRHYVAGSAAEFSAAQGIYVETRSGWFSDRTTRYLASGRPALVQDTGFSEIIPVGKGLVAFSTLEEAAAGARSILADYDCHAAAARLLAESYFDSDLVLTRFLEDCDL
ncbi:MAG TPA: hypothetical protein VFF24_07525 [Acidimicrobiia bacterium]|nr:hypothetical protein [Acidimicrobiia bacterium]